ncbi:MAG TPA: D-alanine--D-alanine ligase family protein [Candidatus Saccharimonadales bacterium]|nr:D-alanine--D-alanine ligase family protein [Candidatus Saccharimonadales bacterium]
MSKQTVAVIFGSRSAEHDVSIITALAGIIKPLELTKKYEVVPVYIAKDGRWFSHPLLKDIAIFTSGKIEQLMAREKPVALQFDGGLTLLKPGLKNQKIKIDIVFPATHGTHGEDGELMGLLELANVPYVGCDMSSSVLAMDKVLAKIMAAEAGVLTSKYHWFYAKDFADNRGKILKRLEGLSYPLFVKPPHLGSSIGITKVKNQTELQNAIEVAAHYDDKVLVEEAVPNLLEVTVPIMGNDSPRPAFVEQPLTTAEDFFDFDTKYMQGGKKGKNAKQGTQGYSQLPADLPSSLYKTAEETALKVYKALGCSGIARIDLLIDGKTNKIYFNEVNPLPGSLYAHNWRAAGVSSVQLVEDLIDFAKERHTQKQKLATVFDTNYLKQF